MKLDCSDFYFYLSLDLYVYSRGVDICILYLGWPIQLDCEIHYEEGIRKGTEEVYTWRTSAHLEVYAQSALG